MEQGDEDGGGECTVIKGRSEKNDDLMVISENAWMADVRPPKDESWTTRGYHCRYISTGTDRVYKR